jgi:hypothetical protein
VKLRSNTFSKWVIGRIIKPAHTIFDADIKSLPDLIFYVDANLHSPERRLIELRMEHGDLDALIDRAAVIDPINELAIRRLKKKRLALRDKIAKLECDLVPKEPA